MSYPIKFRELVIKYRRNGHTLEETSKHFEIAACTISDWEKLLKEKGSLEKRELNRTFKKIDTARLKEYVREHPDAYQSEIAEVFCCCTAWAVGKALKRLKITRKKTKRYINAVIVMDNAVFYRKKVLYKLTEESGRQLIFLPPYSPELNPNKTFLELIKKRAKENTSRH